jgi:hypothetical protein
MIRAMQRTLTLLIALLLAPLAALFGAESATSQITGVFDKDGRSVTIMAPGFSAFSSRFSASIEVGGKRVLLSSAEGSVQRATSSNESTPYGQAVVTTSTIRFEAEHLDLMLRLGQVPGVPGVLFQAGIRNTSEQPVRIWNVTPVQATASLPIEEWAQENDHVYLDPSYAQLASQDWGKCQFNMAVAGKPLSIAGKSYAHGLGTHSQSELVFPLDGVCDRFHTMVGADDEGGGSMAFEVWADGVKLFASGVLKKGAQAKEVDVSVAGVKTLRLVVADGGMGINGAHADWADAYVLRAPQSRAVTRAVQPSGITVEGDPADWLVTRLVGNFEHVTPGVVCPLDAINAPLEVQETGAFYRHDGVGFLFAPVGEPIAYLKSSITYAGKGRVSLDIVSEMSGVQVDPGEMRWGQQAILLMEEPNVALARQAEWVGKTHHARTDKGALHGWCSWYLKTDKITGEDVLGIVDAVKKSAGRLRPAAIQIDDGYQEIDGIWDANTKFPEGMPFYARKVAETGARPGLWMAMTMIGRNAPWLKDPANMETVWEQRFKKESGSRPDETGWIDPTHPRAKAHIADRVRHAVESGYTYLKLDFNNIGGGGWYEKKRTAFEIMRDHYTNIRKAAGEDTYILFCTSHPIRATVGLVEASRTSQDAHRGGVRAAMDEVLRSYELNGRWFAVDNDCYYLATELKGVGHVTGGWPLLKTWASMMGLSSGAAFTSDLWQWDVFRPHWRMTEIMTPPAKERTEILDLGTAREWPRLLSKVQRPWGNWAVTLLWNPTKQEQAVTLDFAKAGLDPAHRYAVWSFWDDRFLGIAKGRWTTPALPVGGCQHLCLTDLDSHALQPVVIGSNLHIFCGAAEFKNVTTTSTGIDIELTDAGARDGDLFLYNQKPFTAGRVSGCTVKSLESTGENIWKLHLEGRESSKPQKIGLTVAN